MNLISIPGAPWWFDALLNLSAQATILSGLVWMVLKLAGRWIPPSWRAWMWFLVIARVLIPFAPSSQLSLQNLFVHPFSAAIVAPRGRIAPPAILYLHVAFPAQDSSMPLPVVKMPETSEKLPAAAPIPVNWGFVSATVWISAAIFWLAVLAARSMVIRYRLVQHGFAPAEFILELIAACRAQLHLRYPVRATASDRIAAPALTGLIPARLIVPTTFGTERFSVRQIRQILLHELAHVQQGHLLLHWLALIARAIHWFNPAIHFAANQLRQECELAADAAALKNSTEQERAHYGETILQVLAESTAPRTLLALGMAEQAGHLKQRLRALRGPTQHPAGVGFICILLLASTGLTGATNPTKERTRFSQNTNLSPAEMIRQFATRDIITLPTNEIVSYPERGDGSVTNVTRLTTVQFARRLLLSGDIEGAESELQKGVENGTLDSVAVEDMTILRPLGPVASARTVIITPNSPILIDTVPAILPPIPRVPVPLAPPATTNNIPVLSDIPFLARVFRSERHTNIAQIPSPSGRLDTLRNERLRNSPEIEDSRVLMEMGRFGEVEQLLKRALDENPDNRAARDFLNQIKERRGVGVKRWTVTGATDPQKIEDDSTNGTRSSTNKVALSAQKMAEEPPHSAIEDQPRIPSEEVRKQQARISTLIESARFLIEIGRLDEAEQKLKEVTEIDPENRDRVYYSDLIKRERRAQEARKWENTAKDRLAAVEKSWDDPTGPVARELLPHPNPLVPDPVYTSPGRQAIYRKLETIRIDEFPLSSETELIEVLKELGLEIGKRDPGGRVNLIVTVSDGLDAGAFKIKFNPPIHDVTLKQLLDAIVMVAQPPQPGPNVGLAYSVEDYAVVFRPRRVEQEPMVSRTFKVDPNLFLAHVEGVFLQSLDGSHPVAGAANADLNDVRQQVRNFFSVAGVDFPTNNVAVGGAVPANFGIGGPDHVQEKALFFNDRAGVLYVRAPLRELDLVENAIHALNTPPPKVRIDVRVYETSAAGLPPEARAIIAEPQLPLIRTLMTATNVGWLSGNQFVTFLKAARNSSAIVELTNMSRLTVTGRPIVVPLNREDLLSDSEKRAGLDLVARPGGRSSSLNVTVMAGASGHPAFNVSCLVTTTENVGDATNGGPKFRTREVPLVKKNMNPWETLVIAAPTVGAQKIPVLGEIPNIERLFTHPDPGLDQRIWLILVTPVAIEAPTAPK